MNLLRRIAVVIITSMTLLASASWADFLDKASAFNIEQDALTGNWNLECFAEVSGIDSTLDHHVGADMSGPGGRIFNATLNILAAEKRIVRTLDRVDYEIKKMGTRLKVSIDVSDYYPAGTNDAFGCTINIIEGTTPGNEGDTLTNVHMTQQIRSDGRP